MIRNAIRLVLGANSIVPGNIDCEEVSDFHLQPTEYRIEALRNSLSILRLPDLDRLIFVICVLERYSILDCALLLKKSPQAVNDARLRAITQLVSDEEQNRHESTTAFPTSAYAASRNGIGEVDDSCGSVLD